MRFSTIIVSAFATLAVASPVTLFKRCSGDSNGCFVGQEIVATENYLNTAVSIALTEAKYILGNVSLAENAIASAAETLKDDIVTLSANLEATVIAQIQAEVQGYYNIITNDLQILKGDVATVGADLSSEISAITSSVNYIVSIIGECA